MVRDNLKELVGKGIRLLNWKSEKRVAVEQLGLDAVQFRASITTAIQDRVK
jgi:hypothetical protein